MHSIKNTIVAVGLLAVSFGLYQVSLTPKDGFEGGFNLQQVGSNLQNGVGEFVNNGKNALQTKLDSVQQNMHNDLANKSQGLMPGTTGNGTFPKLPTINNPFANSGSQNSVGSDRVPVDSTLKDKVQSINYPNLPKTDLSANKFTNNLAGQMGSLGNSAPSQMQPTENQNDTPPEISHHQPVDDARDQNLIDALQHQQDFAAAMSADPADTTGSPTSISPDVAPSTSDHGNAIGNQFESVYAGSPVNTTAPTTPNIDPTSNAKDSPTIAQIGQDFGAAIVGDFDTTAQPTQPPPTQPPPTPSTQFKTPSAPTNDLASSLVNQFQQTENQAEEITPSAGNEFMGSVQPIATADTTVSGTTATQPVSANVESKIELDPNVLQAGREPQLSELTFNAVWPKVDQLVAEGDFRTSLELLSQYYRDETLTGPQRQRLLGWLDALAGKVIFSQENHLASAPYVVSQNESLSDVAAKWQVPPQLIFNVHQNSLPTPADIKPGTQLKSIPGPFSAEIDLQAKVMTLFLGDLYAGRYPIRVGISGQPQSGEFSVVMKSEIGHAWRDANGTDYPPGSPQNGYGPNWIGLTGSLCIHAVDSAATDGHHGCIGLAAKDSKDVFAILAENATVKIVR